MSCTGKSNPPAHVPADVLVLGGGLGAYRAAIAAKQRDARLRVVMAYRAHGASPHIIGFNAPIGAATADAPGDSSATYYEDTLRGGRGLNHAPLARHLAEHAAAAFEELVALGVPFSRQGAHGPFAQRHLSGNSCARSVFVPGGTGRAAMSALIRHARAIGIEAIAGHQVVDLLRDGDRVAGALLWKPHSDRLVACGARAVVIALGGIGRLYEDSTYPADVNADAYGLALDAGAALMDMEFVQFEPVVTVWPPACRGMEMPTAMLGDGARLLNARGERFLASGEHPQGERGMEKARMAMLIQREIDAGRGWPEGGVRFDTTVVPPDKLESYVSHCARLRRAGVDPARTAPLVAPAAHSMMGGIAIDARGWTGVRGLYAGGEAAGGVHGASRLAGNGCTDTLVFGALAGSSAAEDAASLPPWQAAAAAAAARRCLADAGLGHGDAGPPGQADAARQSIRHALSRAAGIWRTGAQLAAARDSVAALRGQLRAGGGADLATLLARITARRMADAAGAILGAALMRRESRGAHQRTDFPARDDARWRGNIHLRRQDGGAVAATFVPAPDAGAPIPTRQAHEL
ncbi:FAD-binding protein [Cupriavidus sp. 30B13]|uniref:FAD-binding protein n=1 Tax=Cupriavidus sp. 30B13 TaxID=3384241 RepID=UPI003CEA5156